MGLRSFFALLARKLHASHSSRQGLSGEPWVSIVKLKTSGANLTRSPPFWADDTKAHETATPLIPNIKCWTKCKLLFDLVVHQQQHLHWKWQHSSSFGEVWEKFHQTLLLFCTAFYVPTYLLFWNGGSTWEAFDINLYGYDVYAKYVNFSV